MSLNNMLCHFRCYCFFFMLYMILPYVENTTVSDTYYSKYVCAMFCYNTCALIYNK